MAAFIDVRVVTRVLTVPTRARDWKRSKIALRLARF
jgi:hypothetical protein